MKSCLLICLFLFLHPASSFAQDEKQPAPEFSFVTIDGLQVTSSELKGKVIVLDFWSTDCNPCRKSMPQLEEFYKKYKNDGRVAVFIVNSGWEPIEKARDFAASGKKSFLFFSWGGRYDLPFAYDEGSRTLAAFGFNANPSMVIIDSHFRIRVTHSGMIQNFSDYLTEQVEKYLTEN